MFKIIKYVIFPITIALLLVIGIILSLNSNLVTIFEYIGLSDIQSERYLKTNDDFIDKLLKLEKKQIPKDIDYDKI